MQSITSNQLTLLSTGNSDIYAYGPKEKGLVLKVVPSSSVKEQRHLKNQFLALQSLRHPNIITSLKYRQNVTFMGNQQDKQLAQQSTHNILVLEYATKGDLLNYLIKYKPDINQKRTILRQIVKATNHIHQEGIAHRDLKLQNILVFEDQEQDIFKLADFGFSNKFRGKEGNIKFKDYKGTKKGYMAPQIHNLRRDPNAEVDAPKADIFALGVIIFITVMGRFPFEYAQGTDKLYKLLKNKQYDLFWQQHKIESLEDKPFYRLEEFKNLFQKMTAYNPSERPQIEEVYQNGWFSK